MADLEGSVIAEPVESTDVEATVDGDAGNPESDAPSEAPSEDISTESSEPDADGSTSDASDDDDGDKPVITRRNAKQIAEKAVQDALAAQKRATDLERQLESQKHTEEALTEEMQAFVGRDDEVQKLRDMVSKPLGKVDPYDLDAVRMQQATIDERDAAMERLGELTKRQELLPKMLGRVRASFATSVYDVFDGIANDLDGVDRAVFVDHLMADSLKPDDVKTRLKTAFNHLYEAGKTSGANEWKGRYEAEKKAHSVTKASAGGTPSSPESGGRPSASGSLTFEKWQSMSAQDRINLRLSPEGRAQIDAMTQRGGGG